MSVAPKFGFDAALPGSPPHRKSRATPWILAAIVVLGLAAVFLWRHQPRRSTAAAAPARPAVTVSLPIAETLASRTGFLGQFSAVNTVDIRAQVGGTLTDIHFQDGQIVNKGDLLFIIDPRPYEIRLATAVAAVNTAQAKLVLAKAELWRAQQLKQTNFGTAQDVDQRVNDQSAATAAVDTANAAVRDAQLDLDYCQVKAPFRGRVSSHRVSIGSLVSGSRAGSSPTTLLTTIVSIDPIYLNFDMSENDYLAYARAHPEGTSSAQVDFQLGDEDRETRQAKLDFIDNAIDRASGTIHARATAPNADAFILPGAFARLSLVTGRPRPSLVIPETALSLDQSNHVVMTVGPDDTVVAKVVMVGDLLDGKRVITGGLLPTDRVVVDGLARAVPGRQVTPQLQPASDKG